MKASVVIPVRNHAAGLKECLAGLQRQVGTPGGLEIVVVDDGSSDGSADVAEGCGVRVIRQEPRGAAAARNRGVREARGEIILFTDADCVPEPEWAGRLVAAFAPGENAGKKARVAGAVGYCTSEARNGVAALVQLELEERYSRMARQPEVDFLNTGNCAFRRELLLQHPFNEAFQWLEDVELSFRLARNGNRMVFVPGARVRHFHPESLWEYLRRKFRYASFAPAIYRRYPGKAVADSRTPLNRRLQLLFLALALAAAPLWWPGALALAAASLAGSAPLVVRAFHASLRLGLLAPGFVLAGNLAFLAGTVYGLFRRRLPESTVRS